MKNLLFALPLISLISPAWASLWEDVPFGSTVSVASRSAAKSDQLEARDVSAKMKKKLQSAYSLKEKMVFQDWVVTFIFARNEKKKFVLQKALLVGDEGFAPELYDDAIKSYYMYCLKELEQAYSLGERPANNPLYGTVADLKPGFFHPLHSYKKDGVIFTLGLILSKADELVHMAYELTADANDTALGSHGVANMKGLPEQWEDISSWERQDAAEDFLVKNGLKKAKKEAGSEPSADENTGEEATTDENTGEEATTDESTGAEPTPKEAGPFDKIDSSLSQQDQDIFKALILFEAKQQPQDKEAVELIISAARAGSARAYFILGNCYNEGRGVKKDLDRGKKAITKAAQLGYAPALVQFGSEFATAIKGLGLSQQESNDLRDTAYQAAAAGAIGSAAERFNLAVMLRYGYGLRKDVEQAHSLLELLASQGDIEAEKMLKSAF